MSGQHARLSPSSAGRWGWCPGSVQMESHFPDEGDGGLAGEASHWVGAELLSRGVQHQPGETAPNGVILDHEMVQGALTYRDAVARELNGEQPYCWMVEQKMSIASIHPDCWGTPDLWYYLQNRNELHVWDYKYGWIIVEVIKNLQLLLYSIGALDMLGLHDSDTTLVLHIVQPRPYHALGESREYRFTLLQAAVEVERLRWAAANALSAEPRIVSGPHCRYCRARHACPALLNTMHAGLDYTETARLQLLTPEELATQLSVAERAQEAITAMLTGLQAQAVSIIDKGGIVPGWTIERGQGRSKWNVPPQQVFAVGDLYKVNLRKPEEPITPVQAKKAGIPAELIRQFADTPLGDPKLVKGTRSVLAQVFARNKS